MPKKRYTPEEIVAKLRQVDVVVSQGQNIADAIRQIGVSEVSRNLRIYSRWCAAHADLKRRYGAELVSLAPDTYQAVLGVSPELAKGGQS